MSSLLDTNVPAETVQSAPPPGVVVWLQAHPLEEAFLSALTIGEIVQGIVRAPVERRPALQTWPARVRETFAGRILPLDAAVMEGWGRLTREALVQGRLLSP